MLILGKGYIVPQVDLKFFLINFIPSCKARNSRRNKNLNCLALPNENDKKTYFKCELDRVNKKARGVRWNLKRCCKDQVFPPKPIHFSSHRRVFFAESKQCNLCGKHIFTFPFPPCSLHTEFHTYLCSHYYLCSRYAVIWFPSPTPSRC